VTLCPTISNQIRGRTAGHPSGLVTPEGVGKPAFDLFIRHGTMLPGVTRRDVIMHEAYLPPNANDVVKPSVRVHHRKVGHPGSPWVAG